MFIPLHAKSLFRRRCETPEARQQALGRARMAEFLAAGYVVHVDSDTLGRSTMAAIVRHRLVTRPDGSPIRAFGFSRPDGTDAHSAGNLRPTTCHDGGCNPVRTDVPDRTVADSRSPAPAEPLP